MHYGIKGADPFRLIINTYTIMKLSGIVGTGTGKLGSSVFATIAGKQIVRQYQPNVSNPSTPGQVAQRAKMKLMSQVAASMSPVIAMKRIGLQSGRNIFIKKNFNLSSFNDETAEINLEGIQLTDGVGNALVFDTSWQGTGTNASVTVYPANIPADATAIVFACFKRSPDGSLTLVDSKVKQRDEEDVHWSEAVFTPGTDKVVIYVYYVSATDARAKAKFASYNVQDALELATLITTRTIDENDIRVSGTIGFISTQSTEP